MNPKNDVAGTPQPGTRHVPERAAELGPPAARRTPRTALRPSGAGMPALSSTLPPGADRPGTPARRGSPRSAPDGGSQAPVTAVPDEPRVSGPAAVTGPSPAGGGKRSGAPSPAGSTPLAGQEARDAIKAAQSAHNADKRRGRVRRAAEATGPGG